MSPLTIRPMLSGDIDGVIALAAELHDAPHWSYAVYHRALDAQQSPTRIALIAENHSQILGFIIANLVPPSSELETIAVAPFVQRQGVAAQLLDVLSERLRDAGVEDIHLEVRNSNLAALNLYRRHNFFQIGTRSRYYIDPIEDALVMQRNLVV